MDSVDTVQCFWGMGDWWVFDEDDVSDVLALTQSESPQVDSSPLWQAQY
jgi:hypothetical protein